MAGRIISAINLNTNMKIEAETRYLVEIKEKTIGFFRDKVTRDTKDYVYCQFQYKNGNANPPTSVTFISETTNEKIVDIYIEKVEKARFGKWFEHCYNRSSDWSGEARITLA